MQVELKPWYVVRHRIDRETTIHTIITNREFKGVQSKCGLYQQDGPLYKFDPKNKAKVQTAVGVKRLVEVPVSHFGGANVEPYYMCADQRYDLIHAHRDRLLTPEQMQGIVRQSELWDLYRFCVGSNA